MNNRLQVKFALVLLLNLLLASCSHTPAALPSTQSTHAPSRTGAVTATPTATGKVTATAMATPTGQHPLPTPGPTPTARPANAPLDANDYYIVTQNGREGVVDRNGKIVLKPEFVNIDIAAIRSYSDAKEQCCYSGKPLFLAVPVQAGPASAKRRRSGYLYNADGTMVTSARLSYAQAVGPDLIAVSKALPSDDKSRGGELDDLMPANSEGAILYSGRLVIPCEYLGIYQFGKTAAALKEDPTKGGILDFYDLSGNLLSSVPAYCKYSDNDSDVGYYEYDMESCNNLLIIQSPDGKYGILNEQLQWVAQPEWDLIQYDPATGQFIVMKNKMVGVVDSKGSIVVPLVYNSFGNINEGSGDYSTDQFYTLTDASGINLIDAKGHVLFHSGKYNYLQCSNGIIIAQQLKQAAYPVPADRSDLYHLNGDFLISIQDDIKSFLPEYGYFESRDRIYDSTGQALPFLGADSVTCLTKDRFIVCDGSVSGLCDAQGRWIIQPKYMNLTPLESNALCYAVEDDNSEYGEKVGLADLNGHILTDPIFYDFEDYGLDRYYVDTGTVSGYMDSNWNWIWKTSIYDGLSD